MQLRYGMNPHQTARVLPRQAPARVVSGTPSYINLLDALTGWQLVREAAAATGSTAAASIKHTSPAGVAVAGPLDSTARETWSPGADPGALTSAYIRARDADPKSSFGDMIAVSAPVDAELAAFLAGVVSDGIIAPGFEPGTVGRLAAKKRSSFLVLEADGAYRPPAAEQRDIFGLVVEQQRDDAPLTPGLLQPVAGGALPPGVLPPEAVADALLGMATLRYTQSNSVALVHGGATLAVAAGQQNRVDCIRLCVAKASTWWLRRHPVIRELPAVAGMTRQDRLNWQIRLADGDLTPGQAAEFSRLYPGAADLGVAARRDWLGQLSDVTLVSDGYLPFRDNIEHATRIGVRYVVEPGGSSRSDEVAAACSEYGMVLVRTGLRLFRH
jgi:phosphoribosylaminoimidazolecarboxamide formyltransferase/IMP cyclohydrolase